MPKVYPIPGRFVGGEPMTERDVSKTEADRLVATGGFASSAKEAKDQAFTTPPAVEIDQPKPTEEE